jgi:hypothetical protein
MRCVALLCFLSDSVRADKLRPKFLNCREFFRVEDNEPLPCEERKNSLPLAEAKSLQNLGALLVGRRGFRRNANALFRRQQRNENVAFHAGHRFNLPLIADFAQQTSHLGAAYFLVRHFPAAVEDHCTNFVTFAQELEDLILANLKIMLRGGWAKLNFLQLRATAALALFVSFLILLILKFAVIGDLANRGVRRGRDFHQVQATFPSQAHGLERLHDAQLPTFFVNHPDFPSANTFVDTDAIGLPEIPLCDKTPSRK